MNAAPPPYPPGAAPDRIFAVGDIHGSFQRLARLLTRLPLDPARDRIVFLGDYINRGPQSREVIDLLLDLERRAPRAVFLLGNHEHDLLEYARTGDVELLRGLREMGVEATLASYGNAPMQSLGDLSFLPPEHRDFLERLLPSWREPGYLFAHAGVLAGPDGDDRPSLTARGVFLRSEPRLDEIVVFGHTGFATPLVAPGRIGLDTRAARGGPLTALELPGPLFHHS